MKQITVMFVEDHTVVREGLRKLVEVEADMKIIGESDNGRTAVRLAARLRPDVVVMDIAMPGLNGLEATAQILKAHPAARVLMLSAHSDDAYVERAMAIGAAGYLIKQTSFSSLIAAIRHASQSKPFLCPYIGKRFQERNKKTPDRLGVHRKRNLDLTPREAEVLQLVAEGGANKQMATALGVSVKTIEKHRQSLMKKLNIHDTAGLTRYAIAAGFIESSVQVTILE